MRYQVASAAPVRPAAMSLLVWALMAVPAAHTREKKPGKPHRPPQESARKAAPARKAALATAASLSALASQTTRDGEAEAALIEVYRRIGQGRLREALAQSDVLVKTHPNFQLAQLVHGDLLSAHRAPITALGDVPADAARKGAAVLADLREESMMRLKALREKPPADTVPSQFLQLAPSIRHAVAVDASRSRLYLFENSASGTRLVADYYVSVGKLGTDKLNEGDQRTPLGIYFITSHLNPGQLKDFYGAGALPINYPNPLDNRRGKTGSGIWLHGTPPRPVCACAQVQRRLHRAGQPRPAAPGQHSGRAQHTRGHCTATAVGQAAGAEARNAAPLTAPLNLARRAIEQDLPRLLALMPRFQQLVLTEMARQPQMLWQNAVSASDATCSGDHRP
jgi:hypothetical protein